MPLDTDTLRELPTRDLRTFDAFLRKIKVTADFDSVGTDQLQDNAVGNQELRNSAGVSVIGRSANSLGDPADIIAAADNQFLARRANALTFGALVDADIPAAIARDAEVTAAIAAEAVFTAANLAAATAGLNLASGTYTPTLTNVANLDGSTAHQCQYLRVGETVHVSGRVGVNPSAPLTGTTLGISLPIASNFANAEDCAGVAYSNSVPEGAAITADTTNSRASMEWISNDVTNLDRYFMFSYQII